MTIAGGAFKPNGGSWVATSDVRVKRDIFDFTASLTEIEKLRAVRFKYNGLGGTQDTGKEYVGVIAQEVEKVLPFMVSSQRQKLHETDVQATDIKQVDPSAFTFVLINAVQELSRQNKQKEADYNELARQVGDLRDQNKQMLSQMRSQVAEMAMLMCQDHPTRKSCRGRLSLTER